MINNTLQQLYYTNKCTWTQETTKKAIINVMITIHISWSREDSWLDDLTLGPTCFMGKPTSSGEE